MLNSVLTSLSVITSFHDKNKSVLEAFLPIVEYGIATLENNTEAGHCDVKSLQEKIYDSTKIKISMLSLVSLLKRFAKNKVIELMENDTYYRILDKARTTQTQFSEAIRSHSREISKFIKEYAKFANDIRQDDEIIEWIYQFINSYRTNILIEKGDLSLEKGTNYNQYKSFVLFLNEINQNDNSLIKTFLDIYYGYNLCCVLNTNQEIKTTRLNELSLFVDSNFILRLMDLQAERYTVESTELYEILKSNRARLRIFAETIEEIRSVIKHYFDIYKNEYEKYNAMFDEPEYIDGVLGAFFRRKLTFTQIDDIIDNLDKTIKDYGLEVDHLSSFKFRPNEEDTLALYRAKYGNLDDDVMEYRWKKCENYLSIVSVIDYLRTKTNSRASCLGNCYCAFLTCDRKLYYYHKNSLQDDKYPLIITQEYLANDLLLFAPQAFGEISIRLIVSLYRESEYLDVHVIDDLGKKILEISRENPSVTDYVVRATRNSKNFTKINEIYDNNEGNDKRELISMAQEVRDSEIKDKEQREHEIKTLTADLTKSSTVIAEQLENIGAREAEIVVLKIRISENEKELKNQNKKYYEEEMDAWYKKHKRNSIIVIVIAALLFGASTTLSCFKDILTEWLKYVSSIITGLGAIFSVLSTVLKTENFGLERRFKKMSNKLMRRYSLDADEAKEINLRIKGGK